MALSDQAHGTLTTSGTTEHQLSGASFTTAGIYVLMVDLNDLAGGTTPDIIEIRAKTKPLTGGTIREAYQAVYQGGLLTGPIAISVPVPSLFAIDWTIKAIQGGADIPWVVMTL
jgi:hypothetical protein